MEIGNPKNMSVKELEEAIAFFNSSYYNEGKTLIPDTVYDTLVEELRSRSPESKELDSLGDDVQRGAKTFRHPNPVLSLAKIHEGKDGIGMDQLRGWIAGRDVVVEPKYDGLTLVLYIEKGRLVKAVTRGNGTEGEVIPLDKVLYMVSPCYGNYTGAIRGEVVVAKSNEGQVESMGYSNLRACAVGQLRNNKLKWSDWLITFIPFDASPFPGGVESRMELRGWLMEMFDLVTLPNEWPEGEALTDEYIRDMAKYLREDNAYPTDGIVFKLNQKNAIAAAGEATAHHPKDAVAFKFNPQGVETTLRDVIWQVGRTGVLTPVAVFDTVKIGGTNVSRATLSNVANAASFHIGDTVEVIKAGEIIPYIRKVRGCGNTVSVVPLTCPCCGSTLSSSDLNIFCTNPLCRDKVAAKLEYACGKNALDIDGMGLVFSRMIADKLLAGENDVEPPTAETAYLHHPFLLLMSGTMDNLINGIPGTQGYRGFLEIVEERKHHATLAQWITAMEIPHVGCTRAESLSYAYPNLYSFLTLFPEDLRNKRHAEFGPLMTEAILNYMETVPTWNEMTAMVMTGDIPNAEGNVPKSTALRGVNFVITGTLSQPRHVYNLLVQDMGGTVKENVSRKTNYLVVGKEPGEHKQKIARLHKIPSITEEEFMQMLNPSITNEKNSN